MKDPKLDYVTVHDRSKKNHQAIMQVIESGTCGCFHCCDEFSPTQIEDWVDGGMTALCPLCGIDSVLIMSDDITMKLLKDMRKFWF